MSECKGCKKYHENADCKECEPDYKTTNADRIRAMSDEELAEFLEKVNETCIVDALGGNTRCDNEDITCTECRKSFVGISKWLQSEAE